MFGEGFLESLAQAGGKELLDEVEAEFRLGWQRERVQAELQEQSLSESCTRLEAAAVDGLGAMTMSVSADSYFYWKQHGQTALGERDVWKHDEFRKDYLRKNPQCRVKYRSAKPRVGWTGGGPATVPRSGGVVLTDKRGGIVPR